MKICILGKSGELSCDLINCLVDYEVNILDRHILDITKFDIAYDILYNISPDIIILLTEYADMLKCENNPDLAYKINVEGTKNIIQISKKINCTLFVLSTNHVFDGSKGHSYNEYDKPNPINQYGKTKLATELLLHQYLKKYYIIRTGALFGSTGTDFIKSTLNLINSNSLLKVVDDQIINITYSVDLSNAIKKIIIEKSSYGIYHLINEGQCSWFEIAKEIFEIKNKNIKLLPISISDVDNKIKRGENLSLNNNSNIKLRFWKDALEEYLIDKNV